jgi:excisionase family DNA binding protein
VNERFYSINELTAMFGVTRTAVYDWMKTGKLDFGVVGTRRRVLQSHLDAFIQAGTQAAKAEMAEKNATPGLAPTMAV